MPKNKKEGNIPADLGLVVATQEEALWMRTRDQTKQLIKENENALIINKSILVLAEQKIKLEQRKI